MSLEKVRDECKHIYETDEDLGKDGERSVS